MTYQFFQKDLTKSEKSHKNNIKPKVVIKKQLLLH